MPELLEEMVREIETLKRRVETLERVEVIRPRSARIQRTTAQTLPSGAWTALVFNAVGWDTGGFFSLSTPSVITIPLSGRYLIGVFAAISTSDVGQRRIRIVFASPMAGDARRANVGDWTHVEFIDIYYVTAGSSFTVQAFQNSGSTLDMAGHAWVIGPL